MAKRLKFGPEGPVAKAFVPGDLNRVCTMAEENFGRAYGLTKWIIKSRKKAKNPNDFFFYKDNGSDVLAVAHLDTVANADGPQALAKKRAAHFVMTEAGPVVYSRALDDRLGAYIILELLPKLGITCDILLTVGEETSQSTAEFFHPDKQYNWMIEFDRGGSDVVMYQYADTAHEDLIRAVGAKVAKGIFSDICYLDHLGCRGFNWGTGYQEYHTAKAHAYLDDTFEMVTRFLRFHECLYDIHMPYEKTKTWTKADARAARNGGSSYSSRGSYGWGDYYDEWDLRPRGSGSANQGSGVSTGSAPKSGTGSTGPTSPAAGSSTGYVGSAPGNRRTSPGTGGTDIPRGADRRGSRYGSSVNRDYSRPLPSRDTPPASSLPNGRPPVPGRDTPRPAEWDDDPESDSTLRNLLPVTDPFMVSDEHPGVVLSKAEQATVLVPLGGQEVINGPEDDPGMRFPT